MNRKTLFILVTLTFLLLVGCGKESLPVETITPTLTATQPRPTATPSPSATPTKRTQFVTEYTPVPTEQAWLETALFPVPYQPVGVYIYPTPIATPDMQGYRFQLKDWSEEDALALIHMVNNYIYDSDEHGPPSSRWALYELHTPLKLSITEAIYRFPNSRYSQAFQWKLALTNGLLGIEDTDDWIVTTLEDGLNSGLYKPEDLERVLFLNGFALDMFGVSDLFGPGEDGQILIISPQFNYNDAGLLLALREIKEGEYDLILMDSYWKFLQGGWFIYLDKIVDRTGNVVPEIPAVKAGPSCQLLVLEWREDKFIDLSRGEINSSGREYCMFEFEPEDYPKIDIISGHMGIIEFYEWNGQYYELVEIVRSRDPEYYAIPRLFAQRNFSDIVSIVDETLNAWPVENYGWLGEPGPAFPDLLRFYMGIAYAYQSQSAQALEVFQSLAESPTDPNYPFLSQAAQAFLNYYQGDISTLYPACAASLNIQESTLAPFIDEFGKITWDTREEVLGVRNNPLSLEDACEISLILPPFISSYQPEQMTSLPYLLGQSGIVIHRRTRLDIDQAGRIDWILYIELPLWKRSELIIITTDDEKLETYFFDVDLDEVPDRLSAEFIELPGLGFPAVIIKSGKGFSIHKILKKDSKISFELILDEHDNDFYEIFYRDSTILFDTFFFDEYGRCIKGWSEFWFSKTTYQWDSLKQEFIEIDLPSELIFNQSFPGEAIPLLLKNLQVIQKYDLLAEAAKAQCDEVYKVFSPKRAHLLYLLGLAYKLNGDEALAVQTYYQLWREHPDSAYALMAKAKLELIK